MNTPVSSSRREQAFIEASPYARHVPALDGIRGLAVLGVMASHLFPGTARSTLSTLTVSLLRFGATGVDLFFVLSGFLITGILYDSLQDTAYFRKFYARRALRIFPLYYGILALFAVYSLASHTHYANELWSLSLYLQNTHLLARPIYDYVGPPDLPLQHFWSLAIEEQFYLVWPLILFFVRGRRQLLACCAVLFFLCPVLRAVCWLHGWSYYAVHMNTLLRSDSLLSGAALALILRSRHHALVLRSAQRLLVPVLAFTLFWIWLPDLAHGLSHSGAMVWLSLRYTFYDMSCTLLLAVSLQPGMVATIFQQKWLRELGKYSYGLYVLHLILFSLLQMPLRHVLTTYFTSSKGASVVLSGLICFVLSYLAAWLSFRYYESPFLRLKRLFSYSRPAPGANMHAYPDTSSERTGDLQVTVSR